MSDVQETLIQLFSKLSCDDIESTTSHLTNAFMAVNFDAVRTLPNYSDQYNVVREAKRNIEIIAKRFSKPDDDQVLQCLNLLKDRRVKNVFVNEEYLVT